MRSRLVTDRGVVSAWAVAFGIAISATAIAQPPTVELRLDAAVLEEGETLDGTLVCTNTGSPTLPQMPTLDGLNLSLLSTTPSTNQSFRIVNGRTSQTVVYTYGVRLTARKAGKYVIPPIAILADGNAYQTAPVEITVKKPESGPSQKGDRLVFAEIEVDRRRLYVTQTLRATLTIGIRKVVIDGRVRPIDRLLNTVIDGRSSELSVFREGRYSVSEQTLMDSSGRRHTYEIYRVPVEVRAEQVGDFEVGPVFLICRYPTSLRQGFFGATDIADAKRVTARAEPVIVTVLGPPDADRPADYGGAIGRYTMNVTVKPDRVQQGQPVTLTVSIRGAPLEGIAGPELGGNAELLSRFEFTRDELAGDIEQGARVFRRAIFPRQAGEQSIPPISWSYFDPQDERYVTLVSDPIRITVDPGLETAAKYSVGGFSESMDSTTLTAIRGGISPNYVDPSMVLASDSALLTGTLSSVAIGAPLAWLAVTLVTAHRRRLHTDVKWARRRRACRAAIHHLARAASATDPAESAGACADAIAVFLADQFDLPPAPLTPVEARRILQEKGISQGTAVAVAEFLEQCDAARFAKTDVDGFTTADGVNKVRGWIHEIGRCSR